MKLLCPSEEKICIYVYMYIHIYIYIHICRHTCKYVYIYICIDRLIEVARNQFQSTRKSSCFLCARMHFGAAELLTHTNLTRAPLPPLPWEIVLLPYQTLGSKSVCFG